MTYVRAPLLSERDRPGKRFGPNRETIMPVDLVSLSSDILLYIGQFCELADLFSLSATCTVFWALAKQKSYWLVPLITARTQDPIACPLHDDLRGREVERLKHIARHTLRLRGNWSSPRPRIYGIIKRVEVGEQMDFILQVPGTQYYVLHCRKTGDLVAFDANSEASSKLLPRIHLSDRIADVSPGCNEAGRFSMGLLATVTSFIYQLAIVSLTYDDNGITGMSLSYQMELPRKASYWAVFISSQIIGVLQMPYIGIGPAERTLNLLAYNLKRAQAVTITTDIEVQDLLLDGHSGTWVTEDEVYFLMEHTSEASSTIYRFPRTQLPNDDNPGCEKEIKFCASKNIQGEWPALPANYCAAEGALTADTYYGVPCVSLHSILDDDNTPTMQIRFWSMMETDGEQEELHVNDKSSPPVLTPNIASVTGSLPRNNGPWQLSLIPHSGRYMLIVMQQSDAEATGQDPQTYKMMLVGYDRRTKTCTVHELQMPDDFDLSHASGLSLDDHAGSVSLITTDGYLYIITYA